MTNPLEHEYKISIDPKILELLGPSLYTNIYYVLAELIANAYDANASNVYLIQKENAIIIEDDGTGMSYEKGDIEKYLSVAVETRTDDKNTYTEDGKRKRMGRKGVGKLAALSVSERVFVMTMKDGERSGFVLSRHVGADHKLAPLKQADIKFERIGSENGTSIVMTDPQYGLHKTAATIRKNLLKIFPLVNADFRIHIITDRDSIIVDNFDKEIIGELGAFIILGEEYDHLSRYFKCTLADRENTEKDLFKKESSVVVPLRLKDKYGAEQSCNLEIKGWIGAYRSTRGRKTDPHDFPDNFISLFSNGKLGEYSILPIVGKNKLNEVYIVGQLHIELFEETFLPDMSLSNRQGYKTDDIRYKEVISYVRDSLLPRVIEMRSLFAEYQKKEKNKEKQARQKEAESDLRKSVDEYKAVSAEHAVEEITSKFGEEISKGVKDIIQKEMNEYLPMIGIKKEKVDVQKKRILISHTKKDKVLADIIYRMLSFNSVPDSDIIYTNCDNEDCRIPNRMNIFDYLRDFFVDSYSNEKIFVIYITSNDMAMAWGAVSEVGAGWITQSKHEIFNIYGHTPQAPLDIGVEWQESKKDGDDIIMSSIEFDKFIIKIRDICGMLGYRVRSKDDNESELHKYVSIV